MNKCEVCKLVNVLKAALAEIYRLGATDNDKTIGPNKVVRRVKLAIKKHEHHP